MLGEFIFNLSLLNSPAPALSRSTTHLEPFSTSKYSEIGMTHQICFLYKRDHSSVAELRALFVEESTRMFPDGKKKTLNFKITYYLLACSSLDV